jgi:diguanylate cyclase (GGDEF)-like protein
MAFTALVATIATVVFGLFLYSADQQRGERGEVVAQDTREITILQDARAAALNESTNFFRYIMFAQDQSLEIALDSRSELEAALATALEEVGEGDPEELGSIVALQEAQERLAASYDEVIALVQEGNAEEATALGVALGLGSRSTNFLSDLDSLVDDERADLQAAQSSYARAENRSDLTLFAIVAAWTVLIVGSAFLTFGWIVRPVERTERAARRFASGERSTRAPQHGPAEIAALGASVNEMADALLERSRQLERALAAEHERAMRDPVTGAYNHGAIVEMVKDRLANGGSSFVVIMADVDGLKETNDVYGHPTGDRLLIAVAAAMSTREAIVGRYGGDEFVALLRSGGAPEALAYMEAVRCALADVKLSASSDEPVPVIASLGHAIFPQDASSVDGLIRVSDRAMYEDKRRAQAAGQARPRRRRAA